MEHADVESHEPNPPPLLSPLRASLHIACTLENKRGQARLFMVLFSWAPSVEPFLGRPRNEIRGQGSGSFSRISRR
jgi:hypothetical protein